MPDQVTVRAVSGEYETMEFVENEGSTRLSGGDCMRHAQSMLWPHAVSRHGRRRRRWLALDRSSIGSAYSTMA